MRALAIRAGLAAQAGQKKPATTFSGWIREQAQDTAKRFR
jgi:hypothetical protein